MQGVVGSSPSGSTTQFAHRSRTDAGRFFLAASLAIRLPARRDGYHTSVNNLRRITCVWPLLIALLALGVAAPPAAAQAARGKAIVGVMADMTAAGAADSVTIRIVDNTDKAKLLDIALALGTKLNTSPDHLEYTTGHADYISDKGIALTFTMPVVPRNDGFLPIAPFVVALAPHAAEVQIGYMVQGAFTYRGVQQFAADGVRVSVDPPDVSPPGVGTPMAIYAVNVLISDPNLHAVAMPRYANEKVQHPIWRILLWILLAGLIGAGIGLVGAKLLERWKAAAGLSDTPPTRGPS
jgi:hypothetical protein